MSAPYPWLEAAWQGLAARVVGGSAGHAYLVSGPPGLGKLDLARALAVLALCEAPGAARACSTCRSCLLAASGNHPDLRLVQCEEERSAIVVDQIRELIEFFTLKPHYGTRKLAIVAPAERMNASAANALLKLLEEPPGEALLLLVAHRPGQLPATIRSRCQHVPLSTPAWPDCLDWLEQHLEDAHAADLAQRTLCGAPLELQAELESAEGPPWDRLIDAFAAVAGDRLAVLEQARAHAGEDARRFVDALELLVRTLVLLRAGHAPRALHLPAERRRRLQEIADKLNSKRLFLLLDRIGEERGVVLRSSGVRGAEVIESLFYHCSRAMHTESPR